MAFKPQSQIRSISGHRVNEEGDIVEHEYTLRDNWYSSFLMGEDTESSESFIRAFTTEGGRLYNATHTACPRCKGRGYTRKDENIGCHVCLGLGGVKIDE